MYNELEAAIMAMDPADLEALGLGLGALIIFGLVVTLGRYLIIAIGRSAMYRKAGVAGWKAFIPVYNTYNDYLISWNTKMFFVSAALFVASSILGNFSEGFMAFVSLAVSLALIVVVVMQNFKMAKSFGKGVGTTILLILFPGITSLVLGLGKAQYTPIAE